MSSVSIYRWPVDTRLQDAAVFGDRVRMDLPARAIRRSYRARRKRGESPTVARLVVIGMYAEAETRATTRGGLG